MSIFKQSGFFFLQFLPIKILCYCEEIEGKKLLAQFCSQLLL